MSYVQRPATAATDAGRPPALGIAASPGAAHYPVTPRLDLLTTEEQRRAWMAEREQRRARIQAAIPGRGPQRDLGAIMAGRVRA